MGGEGIEKDSALWFSPKNCWQFPSFLFQEDTEMYRGKRIVLILTLLVVGALFVAACGSQPAAPAAEAPAAEAPAEEAVEA